jgi:hypothetical protein
MSVPVSSCCLLFTLSPSRGRSTPVEPSHKSQRSTGPEYSTKVEHVGHLTWDDAIPGTLDNGARNGRE